MPRKTLMASMWCTCPPEGAVIPLNMASIEWLFENAGLLLWADSLYLTEGDFDHIHHLFDGEQDQEVARLLFDRLRENGVVELFNPAKILPGVALDSIGEQVEVDAVRYGRPVEDSDPEDPLHFEIKGRYYCQPMIRAIYASLTAARFLGSSCLFDELEREYLAVRFGELPVPELHGVAGSRAFGLLYQAFVPALHLEADYHILCNPSRRDSCAKARECGATSKTNALRAVDFILRGRDNKELRALANHLDLLEAEVGPDEARILAALQRDVRRYQRNVVDAFPRIRNWCGVTQELSGRMSLCGKDTGNALLQVGGAALATIAQATEVTVDHLTRKQSWLSTLATKVDLPVIEASFLD